MPPIRLLSTHCLRAIFALFRLFFQKKHQGAIKTGIVCYTNEICNFKHAMATMTISYDGRSKLARSVVDFIRSLDVFTITEHTGGKGSYQLSQEDVRAGRVESFASSNDMFESLGI